MRRYWLLMMMACIVNSSFAQLLATSPDFPTDNSAITITVDCSKGNQGLMNYANTNDVFVHIGVITNLSTNNSDWKYVKFAWGTTDPQAKATWVSANKYQFNIANIRTFFGVPAGETIRKIAILFRNGNGTLVQRTADASVDMGNMYITVYSSAPAAKFVLPPFEPYFNPRPEPINKSVGNTIDLSYKSNQQGTLQLYFNGAQVQSAANADNVTASPTITAAGNQQVVGRAIIGSTTISDTFNFFVAPPVGVLPLPAGVQEGINYLPADTSVILVLYSPGKASVHVLGDFNNWTQSVSTQMNKTPDGNYSWLQINGLTPGAEYAFQYLVDGNLRIADFYAEKLLDPDNDPFIPASTYPNLKPYPTGKTNGIVSVLQTRPPQYTWRNNTFNRPDKRNLVVYELLVRDFVNAHDYKTIRDTLSYLKRLGVNAIELMPINEFEGNISWGYNTSFYFAPDKYYGPKNSLKELIDSCHSNGIAVILDMVLNHSYGQSPMVRMYYDNVNNRPAPDNPWFNPVAPHSAITFGFDFNHESNATKYFVDRITDFWLKEYKVDGFRFDFTKGLTQKVTTSDAQMSAYDSSRVRILKRINDSVQITTPGAYVILEHLADNSEEKDLAAAGMLLWGNLNYNFNEATMGWNAGNNSNFEWATHTARGYAQPHLISYMESHDEERLMYKNIKYGNQAGPYNVKDTITALKRNQLATAFYMAIPGPRMIWQFGELGYDYSRCYLSTNGEGGDCNRKLDPKPIRWDYQQQQARKELYETYASLIKLRKDFPAPFTSGALNYNLAGAFKSLQLTSPDLSIVVVGNFDVSAISGVVIFPSAGTWYNYFSTETFTATGGGQVFNLQPGEFRFYINKNLKPVEPVPLPATFAASVHPNPLRSHSVIAYALPQAGNITIEVFDMLGQRLQTYQRSSLAAGNYSVTLRELLRNRPLSAGLYLLKISSGSNSVTARALMLSH
ncbi:MAG TPA: alpha-amylase family glycosyl hydrolase [Chitinophagaceae bacterium]|nr:alpha-amylase family glycosyl hydrolase [Chitinophagaceae bacterium]